MIRYRLLVALLLAINITFVSAQGADEAKVSRDVVIEKDYSPTVDDATKITTRPVVETPQQLAVDTTLTKWSQPVVNTPESQPISEEKSIPNPAMKNSIGYANFAMGNYLNIDANAGLQILNSDSDQLAIWYNHYSTGGHLSYMNIPYRLDDKTVYQFQNNDKLNVEYKHKFDKVRFALNGMYNHNKFNYYGAPVYLFPDATVGDNTQRVNQYAFSTSMSGTAADAMDIKASVNYMGYNNAIGYIVGESGLIENHLNTNVLLFAKKGSALSGFGLGLDIDNLIYKNASRNSYSIISVAPTYSYNWDKASIKVGVNMDVSANDGTALRFAPIANLNWDATESTHFYAIIKGGKEINSVGEMAKRTIYINPSQVADNSYTPFDFTLGAYYNHYPNFTMRGFVGFKTTNDAQFDYRVDDVLSEDYDIISQSVVSYISQDAYRWLAGVDLKYKLREIIEGGIKWTMNSWVASSGEYKGDVILSSIPRNEIDISLAIYPIKSLDINMNMYLGIGRGYRYFDYYSLGAADKRMNNIRSLNASALYRFTPKINAFVEFNNILSQQYDIFYGMPAQKFNFMIGMGVKL